jgi:hypothetical protein
VSSWRNSLRALSQAFQLGSLNDHGVLIEYQLPQTSKRLDCIVTGRDLDRRDQAVIVRGRRRSGKCSRKFFGYDPATNRKLQSDPSPAELTEKTIDYAEAKTAYFKALRAEVPELMKIATGKETRPPELDMFAAAFAVAGEDQEKVAD